MRISARGRLAFLGVGVAVLVGGLWFLVSQSDLLRASSRLEDTRAAAARAGIPTDFAALHPKPIPPQRNGAGEFLLALQQSPAPTLATVDLFRPWARLGSLKGISTAKVRLLRSTLTRWRAAFDHLDQAITEPQIVLDRPYEKGDELALPEAARTRDLDLAMVGRALVESHDGHSREAMSTLRKLARSIGLRRDDPMFIVAMEDSAGECWLLAALGAVLSDAPLSSQNLQAAREVLQALGPPVDYRLGLRGEFIRYIRVADFLSQSDPEEISSLFSSEERVTPETIRMQRIGFVRRATETRAIEFCLAACRRLPADPTDYDGAQSAFESARAGLSVNDGPDYIVLRAFRPDLEIYFNSLKKALAMRRATEVGLQMLQSRLSTAGGAPPRDPWGSGPLKVRKTGNGFVVYSVGSNRRDDGGRPGPSPADDLAFRYEARQ